MNSMENSQITRSQFLIFFRYLILYFLFHILYSCKHQIQTADRAEFKTNQDIITTERISDSKKQDPTALTSEASDKDLEKYIYELGLDPKIGLTTEERTKVNDRRKVRVLERSLNSDKIRRHYSKILPYLESDQEKIQYLSIDSIEGRQAWINKNNIWSRIKPQKDFLPLVENQDIAIGMTADLVKRSWGTPESIDHSGHEIYKNERWKYTRDTPSPSGYKREVRFVYFEGGQVIGWETE